MTSYNHKGKDLYAGGVSIPYEKPHTKEESTKIYNELMKKKEYDWDKILNNFIREGLKKFLSTKSALRDIFLDFLLKLKPPTAPAKSILDK